MSKTNSLQLILNYSGQVSQKIQTSCSTEGGTLELCEKYFYFILIIIIIIIIKEFILTKIHVAFVLMILTTNWCENGILPEGLACPS